MQVKERFLSAEIDKCRVHSRQLIENYDTPHDDDDDDDKCEEENDDRGASNVENGEGLPGWYCPSKDCRRQKPFDKKKKLRRHFAIRTQICIVAWVAKVANNYRADVSCEEVCVFCFRVFRLASQYIAHAEGHRIANQTKNSYTSQICDALRKRVDDELCLLNRRNGNKKRLSDVADDMAPTPVAHKSRRSNNYRVNGTMVDSLPTAPFDELIGIEFLQMLGISVLTSMKAVLLHQQAMVIRLWPVGA